MVQVIQEAPGDLMSLAHQAFHVHPGDQDFPFVPKVPHCPVDPDFLPILAVPAGPEILSDPLLLLVQVGLVDQDDPILHPFP